MVDGCTRPQAFLKTIVPLLAPGLAATSVFVMIQSWNEFTLAFILTSRAASTLPVYIASFAMTEEGTYWGAIGAITVIVLLPIVIFAFIVQKHLVNGRTLGAVKG